MSAAPPPAELLVVDLDAPHGAAPPLHSGIPMVVVGLTDEEPERHPLRAACDVVLERDDEALDAIAVTVARNPQAATALALLLRGSAARSVEEGLVAESRAYSALQGGPEFAAWLAGYERRHREPEGEPVRLGRSGGVLTITLDRPHVRNALNAAMRDALVEAFALPAADPSITEVHLRGAGPVYSAGGDLDEFGTFPDPDTAHDIRLQQSVGRAIHAVRDRVTAHLHGACAGSGIELPAFAAHVVAAADTRVSLPELSLGLVPGAGGTVSLPRRIGRWRTARLALTGLPVDAATARAWGLLDEIAS